MNRAMTWEYVEKVVGRYVALARLQEIAEQEGFMVPDDKQEFIAVVSEVYTPEQVITLLEG